MIKVMENELAKIQKCVVMRGGFEIWVDVDKAEKLQNILDNLTAHFFVRWEEQTFNTADVVGIFTPEIMEERTKRRNGMWQCSIRGRWHDRGEQCVCKTKEKEDWSEALSAAIDACKKCDENGWVRSEKGVAHCPDCSANFFDSKNKPIYSYRLPKDGDGVNGTV